MVAKRLLLRAAFVLLAAASTYAQFPTAPGNEHTKSYGVFKIKVNPAFVGLFTGCPGFASGIFTSPTLYDPHTEIGVSGVVPPAAYPGAQVGVNNATTGPSITVDPGAYDPPLHPDPSHKRVITHMRTLHMTKAGTPITVDISPWNPSSGTTRPSVGAVTSTGTTDFPADSFFQMFVQITLPPCGGLPGPVKLHNRSPREPLVVKASLPAGSHLPPTGIVYVHDETNVVPIRFLEDGGSRWKKDDVLGCIVFAGHGLAPSRALEKLASADFEKKAAALARRHTAKACGNPGQGREKAGATNPPPPVTSSDTSPESSRTEER